MEAAKEVFSENGYARATTKAIAARAGVAEGTIFIYFRTKQDLLVSCMEQVIAGPLSGIFSNEAAGDEEIIRAFYKNRFELLQTHIGILKVMIAEGFYHPELFREFFERIFSPGLAEISKFLTRRMDSGAFKRLDPAVVARSLIGQFIFTAWMLVASGREANDVMNDELIDTLITTFLDGVRA